MWSLHNARLSGWRLGRLSGWRWPAAIVAVGLCAFCVAAAITAYCPHVPRVHDEFSYLLAADTLLHGRLANPTPDVWQAFQSFHVILEPAYTSKYPLGQAAILAVGWAVCGAPIAGSWLAAALCAASLTWMLGGITARRWAVLGGLLIAVHPAMQVTWSQSLMGGWLTACGSGLLAGGVFRLRRQHRNSAAVAIGLGVALLALTRPFEGLVATLLTAALLWMLWSESTGWQKMRRGCRTAAVAGLPVLAALMLIGWQNYAISGHVTRLPYQLHEQQYGVAPLFVFGQPQVPTMEQSDDLPRSIEAYHQGWSLESYQRRAGWRGWLIGIALAAKTMGTYWVALAIVPLLSSVYWVRFRVGRLLALVIGLQVIVSSSVCWIFPHYLAPIVPWLLSLSVLGLRRLLRLFPAIGRTSPSGGLGWAGAVVAAQAALLITSTLNLPHNPQRTWAVRRAAIEAELQRQGGTHLVLVHYDAQHSVHQEWVYNAADLDNAAIIWARGERPDWNDRLLDKYAQQRFVWQLQADRVDAAPQLLSQPQWD